MSRLELHGNVLVTLLADNEIRRANEFHILLTLLIVTITSSFVFRQVQTRWLIGAGLGSLALGAGLFWAALWGTSIQLSLLAIWTTILLNYIAVLKSRFHILAHFFEQWKLLRQTNIKTTWNASYDEIWSSVATSAQQIFHPKRLVLLELCTGSSHLAVRATIGCEPDEIAEKRRDVSRIPFRSAVDQRSPVTLGDRPFLVNDESCTQYLVPLIDGANVQGMMILEMDPGALSRADFEDRLTEFADKMAAFLAATRERELEKILFDTKLYRFCFLPESIAARTLYQNEVDYRRYEDLLTRALDCSEVAIAIYDVFGNLVKSNKRMIDHLQQQDISVLDTNCADMLAALSGRSQHYCRELVRQCLIDNRAEEILLAPENANQAASVLYVKPLRSVDQLADEGVENRCISIQYVDGRLFHDMHVWQTQFADSQAGLLRDQLSRLQAFATGINCHTDDSELDSYTELAEEVLDAVEQCQSAIRFGLSEEAGDFFAINTLPILQASLDNCKEECESRGVQIKHLSPLADAEAISNPMLLRRIFAFALECLLSNASRQTQIAISVAKSHDRLRYRFDVVNSHSPALDAAHGENQVWHHSGSTNLGKAATVLIQQHSEQLIEISRWLRKWGATLKYECARNYQPSIEIDLACHEPDRHPDAAFGESVKSPSISLVAEHGDA